MLSEILYACITVRNKSTHQYKLPLKNQNFVTTKKNILLYEVHTGILKTKRMLTEFFNTFF